MRIFVFLLGLFFATSVLAEDKIKVELTEVVNLLHNKLYQPVSFEIKPEETKSIRLFLGKQSYPSSALYVFFDGKYIYFTEARGSKHWMASRATRHASSIKFDKSAVKFERIRVKNTEFSGTATSL